MKKAPCATVLQPCSIQFARKSEESSFELHRIIPAIPMTEIRMNNNGKGRSSPSRKKERSPEAKAKIGLRIRRTKPAGMPILICIKSGQTFFCCITTMTFQRTLSMPDKKQITAPARTITLPVIFHNNQVAIPKRMTGTASKSARPNVKSCGTVSFVILRSPS